jgi:hypothetical protein
MTLANAMVLVDQTAVPLTLSEIMRTYDLGSQKAQWPKAYWIKIKTGQPAPEDTPSWG